MPVDFEISRPCNANWQEMKPCGSTRFCNSCSTHVIDGCGKSKTEILHLMEVYKTSCVRLEETKLKMSFLRRAAIFIGGLLLVFGCRSHRGTSTRQGGIRVLDRISSGNKTSVQKKTLTAPELKKEWFRYPVNF